MDKYTNQPQGFSVEQAKKLAQSDAGKQLLTNLQKTHGTELKSAMDQAAAGNYEQVKKTITEMLSSPEVQALLKQVGGNGHG